MRVLVCGGAKFTDFEALCNACNHYAYEAEVLIEGEAAGADKLGRAWAEDQDIPVLPFPANWRKYGRAAGPIRNQQMLDEGKPDLVLAFPTPESRGTWDMVRRAKKAGIRVIICT